MLPIFTKKQKFLQKYVKAWVSRYSTSTQRFLGILKLNPCPKLLRLCLPLNSKSLEENFLSNQKTCRHLYTRREMRLHHCKNVFVTDGACMTSTSTQNPSLTFMAISARAANYAIEQLKKGTL